MANDGLGSREQGAVAIHGLTAVAPAPLAVGREDGAVEAVDGGGACRGSLEPRSEPEPADEPARNGGGAHVEQPPVAARRLADRPLALLAEAAGYKDHELWWEEQIERRSDATGLFAAILEAMRGIRDQFPEVKPKDLMREAYMRKTLRGVLKEGSQNVAVVCGAWHAPVLDAEALAGKRAGCKIKDDNERLSGLPKVKTTATWIPWTYSRLTFRSGYGAGISSPGWYAHLWESNDDAPTRWLTTAARLLRAKDLDASSADVIEARRLADALAAMREIRSPGLTELNEAILTVMCHGEPAPLELIRVGLEIGDVLGEVPDDAPSVPLALDLAAQQSALRLKPSTEIKRLDLDLRKQNDLARSRFLHRLSALGIFWGRHERTTAKTSTFHELWTLQWTPEFAIAIIEANVWGNTVEAGATAKIVSDAQAGSDLSALTSLLETAIVAGLEAAIDPLLDQIQAASAAAADVRHLMNALPPMARVARYGDVRGTQAAHVEPIFRRMFDRALVGIAAACSALDDDAAQRMLESMSNVNEALQILSRDDLESDWRGCLDRLMNKSVHPLVCGWCCRLLLDAGQRSDDELLPPGPTGLVAGQPAEPVCGLGHRALARQRPGPVASRCVLASLRPLAPGIECSHIRRDAAALATGVRRFHRPRTQANGRKGQALAIDHPTRARGRRRQQPTPATSTTSALRWSCRCSRESSAQTDERRSAMTTSSDDERLRRWRLVLGAQSQSTRRDDPNDLGLPVSLAGDDDQMDRVLEALYDSERSAGLGSSSPNVNRWLGDIRTYFPKSVVQVMQKDALERLHLNQMLLEPETLETVEADVQLIGTLLSLNRVIPKKTRETARKVVRKVVDDLERRLKNPMIEAVRGALTRATRTSRPKAGEIDWDRTIRKNLRHYLRDRRTIVAEHLVGFGRRRSALRDVVLCIDQSGSMAASIVYASIFGAVLASLRAVSDAPGRLRHLGCRPDRPVARPGRHLVRHAARRRDRYQPGGRVLPSTHHPTLSDHLRLDLRPVRGRRRRRPASPDGRAGQERGRDGVPARSL